MLLNASHELDVMEQHCNIDKHCNVETQIKHTRRAAHFYLRNISVIRDLLTQEEPAAHLVHSLITSCANYCNSPLYSLQDTKVVPLQSMQNIAVIIPTRK